MPPRKVIPETQSKSSQFVYLLNNNNKKKDIICIFSYDSLILGKN